MPKGKHTIDDYINAILDRDKGNPYPEVLQDYELTPNQFYNAAVHDLGDYIRLATTREGQILQAISDDKARVRRLLNMGEECIKE